ncbi:MAG: NADPH-dependent F420 reductase [Nitriliruptoraceae bacterium]
MAQTLTVGFIGGTGPQGRGLGVRLAMAGHRVLIGSRTAERAQEIVAELLEQRPGLPIEGDTNAAVCETADLLVVVVPYDAQQDTLASLRAAIGSKIVISCVNALGFDKGGPYPLPVPAGSAAEECQQLLPEARVVGAWQNVSGVKLGRFDESVEVDVPITGDDEDARAVVAPVVEAIDGMRAVDAGPLRLTRPIEEMTAVLVSINRRYRIHAGVNIAGLARTQAT